MDYFLTYKSVSRTRSKDKSRLHEPDPSEESYWVMSVDNLLFEFKFFLVKTNTERDRSGLYEAKRGWDRRAAFSCLSIVEF